MLNDLRVLYIYLCAIVVGSFFFVPFSLKEKEKNMPERTTFWSQTQKHLNFKKPKWTKQNNETRLWIISKTMNQTKPNQDKSNKYTPKNITTETELSSTKWQVKLDAFWFQLKKKLLVFTMCVCLLDRSGMFVFADKKRFRCQRAIVHRV